MEQVDGVEPDCRTGACVIPPLDQSSRRVMGIRSLLLQLEGLVDAGTVLSMVEADLTDLVLLAEIETLLKSSKDTAHGQGR